MMPGPKPRRLLTAEEVAKLLGLSVKTVVNLAGTGKLKGKIVRGYRFTPAAVAAFAKKRRGPGRPKQVKR